MQGIQKIKKYGTEARLIKAEKVEAKIGTIKKAIDIVQS